MNDKYREMFGRNIGILTEAEQARLSNSSIGVAGAGGVGGLQFLILLRTGIGAFLIADPEEFGLSDRNRQYGAQESTHGKNKAVEIAKISEGINPYAKIQVYPEGITKDNVCDFVAQSDAIIDAVEFFKVDVKVMLHREARRQKKFVFTSPILALGSSLLVFDPEGMTFEDFFGVTLENKPLPIHKYCPVFPAYVDMAVAQEIMARKRPIPSLAPATGLSAGLLATEVILYLLDRRKPVTVPQLTLVDFVRRSFDVMDAITRKKAGTDVAVDWKKFWDDFSAAAYDVIPRLPENQRMLDRAHALVGKEQHVLDAGCGTGNLTLRLAQDNSVVGIDFSPEMVNAAQSKTASRRNVELKQGDVCELPFPDRSFDAIVSINVHFNLEHPVKAVQEAHRVLKDGGHYVVATPFQEGLTSETATKVLADAERGGVPREEVMKVIRFNQHLIEHGGMMYLPPKDELRALFTDNGFDIIDEDIVYFGSNLLLKAKKR